MKIIDNEEIKEQVNDHYIDFQQRQLILNFEDPLETVTITINDKEGKLIFDETFTMKFINAHINLLFQDMGERSEESLYEFIKVRKE